MKPKNRHTKLAVAGMLSIVLLVGVNRVRSEFALRLLTRDAGNYHREPYRKREERQALQERGRRFDELWKEHRQHDITDELLPLVQEPAERLRMRAVKALGRLESPQAEAPLEALGDRLKAPDKSAGPDDMANSRISDALSEESLFPTLDLALGRIRARDLKGWNKVRALADSARLSWNEVVRLSYKVNDPVEGKYAMGTAGYEIVDEMVDMLYEMGKDGQDISPMAGQLMLRPAQNVKLQAAKLPIKQEIKIILDYLSHLDITGAADTELSDHLSPWGIQLPT